MEKNRIRQVIRGCFFQRDCYPLVRPVINEAQLQNLESLEDYELRQDFLEQLTSLRGNLFSQASTKKLNGNELDGRMMSQLIEQYITKLNGNDVPVVQNIWDYICEENCNRVYEELFQEYEKMMSEIRGVMTVEEIDFSHQNSLKNILGKRKIGVIEREIRCRVSRVEKGGIQGTVDQQDSRVQEGNCGAESGEF